MNKTIWIYTVSIALLSTLTGNYSYLFDPLSESFLVLLVSFGIFLVMGYYSRIVYLSIANKNINEITNGLLKSTLFGAITITLLSLYTYFVLRNSTSNLDELNTQMALISSIIGVIYLLCILIVTIFDTKKSKNISKIRIFVASVVFYFFIFIFSFIIFVILSMTTF